MDRPATPDPWRFSDWLHARIVLWKDGLSEKHLTIVTEVRQRARAACPNPGFLAGTSSKYTRFEIDLSCKDARAAVRQVTPRPRAVEFPCVGAVPPRAPHHYVYGACAAHASLNNPIRDNTAHACRRRPLEAPARLPTRRVNTLPAQRPPRRV